MVHFLTFAKTEFMSRKGKRKKKSGISGEYTTEQILSILSKSPEQGFNYKQIAKRLNINDPSERQMISEILKEACKERHSRGDLPGKIQGKSEPGLYNRYC